MNASDNIAGSVSFEDFKQPDGIAFWWASDLMGMLGYRNMKTFQKVIDRATMAFISLDIPHQDNIMRHKRLVGTKLRPDYKLTRFACYLLVMNGDPKKTEVAQAQAYFIQQTRKFELYLRNTDQIDRIIIREELADGNKSLASAAKMAGVENFAVFHNAGYVGLYNMDIWHLARKRKVKSHELLDHMGRTELAANLFRVTQTEERIRNFRINGQKELQETHQKVGKEVRAMMIANTGKEPEHLPLEKNISQIRKDLKRSHDQMLKGDNVRDT